ncbi:FtsQ-type POTRA domain-containing protein [Clostridium sp. SYSU_GA19001]|uniref:cell division protein FtsQ/DivIB n=1 Tax=Clostridium caldaquaticum TaxID=2940653 RepID=UPI002076EC7B|nr:FtsQ-type POTRA domain-containing protein [Clostridium caldaquaticum]MCM8711008.1 FtsQ-type POTRA domain-containing protein [Clostridium caldaquaticum]
MKTALRNTENEFINKRRRKRTIRRSIIFSLLLISTLITLCLKLSYFNVSNIIVRNNNIISKDEIIAISKIKEGTNIFYMNLNKIRTNVLSIPYILKAEVSRKLPNTIVITVEEREAVFYINADKKKLIIDKQGIVLEEREDISNMQLTNLQGFDFEIAEVGKLIPCDDSRKISFISLITDLITSNSSGIKITSVDLTDIFNIKTYSGDLCIKLGDSNDLKDKLNLALNIINNNNLNGKIGYIDVSFKGNPVVFIED